MNPAERLFLERYVRNPGRNLLRFSFIFMVLGIVLSVAILTAALNLFEGYERALSTVLLDSFPHLRIQRNDALLTRDLTDRTLASLRQRPEVASATPVLSFSVMANNDKKVRGGVLFAYELLPGQAPDYAKYISDGSAETPSGKVVVGHYLASELGLAVGDTLQTTYPRMDRITPLGMYPNSHPLVISGIYRSGFYEFDRSLIIANLADAQTILGNSMGFNSIEIKLKESFYNRADIIGAQISRTLEESLYIAPVINQDLLNVVRMQKWLIFIIFCFLVLIAGINVISGVGTLILDRRNEIAVLKALGAGYSTIRNILGYQLSLVCLGSIVIGQFAGFLLSWLVVNQNIYRLKGEVYFIDKLEMYVSPLNQAVIFLVAASLVILCIFIPLRKINRLQTIDLLRNP